MTSQQQSTWTMTANCPQLSITNLVPLHLPPSLVPQHLPHNIQLFQPEYYAMPQLFQPPSQQANCVMTLSLTPQLIPTTCLPLVTLQPIASCHTTASMQTLQPQPITGHRAPTVLPHPSPTLNLQQSLRSGEELGYGSLLNL